MTLRHPVPVIALAAMSWLPGLAHAEGARTVLDCTDNTGVAYAFTIAPLDIAADGSGSISVGTGGTDTAGLAGSFAGPFTWQADGTIHTLLLTTPENGSGEVRFLYHLLTLDPAPGSSEAIMLKCKEAG